MKRLTAFVFIFALLMLVSVAAAQEVAPVPDTAFGPPIDPEKGYFVEEINDGVYWITEGTYQVMFAVTGEGVIVVDAPPTIGDLVLAAIAEVTDEPITHVIYSHSHGDHIGAAFLYPEDATIIAHEDTAEQLARFGDENRPMPDMTFDDQMTLEVGDKTLELIYPGPNHEPGNIIVYAPDQGVVMFVDVIFPGWSPFQQLALAEDVPGYIAAHDAVLDLDWDTFIGGHLTRLGTREDVELQRQYILDIQAAAADALATTDFFAIAGETGFENQWLLFNTYLGAVAQNCAAAVVPNYVDVLAAADLNTESHCWAMMESLRIDFNNLFVTITSEE